MAGHSQPASANEPCQRHCTAVILQLDQLKEGTLLPVQSLPLDNQETHVTAWWHPQMLCAAHQLHQIMRWGFKSFWSCFCRSEPALLHQFSSEVWLCFYTQSSAMCLHLLMVWGVYPCRKTRSSPQPSATTTASAGFCYKEMPQHREMAQAAIIPALRGWEGPVGREEAGLRGRLEGVHTPCPGRSSLTGWSTEQLEKWSILLGSSLQRLKKSTATLCHVLEVWWGELAVLELSSPAQRSTPHSYVSGSGTKLASFSHTFQNHELTASERSEGMSAHLTVILVKLDTPVAKAPKLFHSFQSLFLCWYCSWWQRAKL